MGMHTYGVVSLTCVRLGTIYGRVDVFLDPFLQTKQRKRLTFSCTIPQLLAPFRHNRNLLRNTRDYLQVFYYPTRSFMNAIMQHMELNFSYRITPLPAHDDVINRNIFRVTGLWCRKFIGDRSPVNSPHKGQWRRALMISLIWAWTNDWVNDRYPGDLRRHRAHYDVIVMDEIRENTGYICQYPSITKSSDARRVCLFRDVYCVAIQHVTHVP